MVAAFYVFVFSFFYSFSAMQWATLVVLIGLVMALEVLNTSIEQLCDLCADRYEPLIKFAKDAAAGAVLIMSLSAAVVAAIFFLDVDVIINIFRLFAGNIPLLVLLLISAAFAVLFVLLGPVGIKNAVTGFKRKKHENK